MELEKLNPQLLWKHFAELCKIPRPSKNEAKAIAYVKDFAVAQGLDHTVDAVGNVIIRKPATAGMEGCPGVVLQAHLDMVPQADIAHDFNVDPIDAYVDGDWVKARGTTLGADNGIGVAAALAVLESNDLQHGPLEALFTIDEETGMTGANGLQADVLHGKVFLNLDSEEEGEICIGCAGGVNFTASIPVIDDFILKWHCCFQLTVEGLKGGHSGTEIHLGRANANKIMAQFIRYACKEVDDRDIRVITFDGGNMRNAIPREAKVTFTLPKYEAKKLPAIVEAFQEKLNAEFKDTDPDVKLKFIEIEMPERTMSKGTQDILMNILYLMPNGPQAMIADMPEVVETSTNLAIVKTELATLDDIGRTVKQGKVDIACLLRSSVDSAKDELADRMTALCELAGAKNIECNGGYPGWKPNFGAATLNVMKDVYRKNFDKDPIIKVIHAGLECAIFGKVYPEMDYVSFGPTILSPHSPGERVEISSVEKFWIYLIDVLKNIK